MFSVAKFYLSRVAKVKGCGGSQKQEKQLRPLRYNTSSDGGAFLVHSENA